MGFEFGKNTVKLEICGRSYEVNPYGESVLAGITAYHQELQGLNATDSVTPDSVHKVCECVRRLVDSVLGERAYAEIFQGREPNFLDHQELVSWLIGSVAAFRAERLAATTVAGMEAAKRILGEPPAKVH